MATINLTKDNFEQVVTGNDTVIVDFWAPWCGPCRGFAPVFEATSEKHAGVVFAKVNTEEEPELAGHFEIRSIPTLMVFREKVMLLAQPGALPAAGLACTLHRTADGFELVVFTTFLRSFAAYLTHAADETGYVVA